jgi:Ni,Fe-hydrogenase I cytochrome b subunit
MAEISTSSAPAAGQQRIYIFKRFERFWHWTQALLILTLLVTGFEVHGKLVAAEVRAGRALCTRWRPGR